MTDEELSELAECLQDACQGKILRPFGQRRAYRASGIHPCCPLGALTGDDYPNPAAVGRQVGIPESIAWGLADGFDDRDMGNVDGRAWQLGRLFREQYSR